MFSRFMPPALIRGSQNRGTSLDGRRSPHGRRPRSFRGGVESLEGRTLLSFGTGGVVTTQVKGSPDSQAFALAVQPSDQKLVVGGDVEQPNYTSLFSLVRYNTDGTLDSTFGSQGVVTTTFNKSDYGATVNSIVVQPSNGKIVAGGTDTYGYNYNLFIYESQFALARYNTNGSLDSTFGKGGKVTTAFPSSDGEAGINTVLLRSDGEIVAVGVANPDSMVAQYVALALYKSNGALDASFGSSGTVMDTSLDTSTSSPNSGGGTTTVYKYFSPSGGTLESDNSILVAGTYVTETEVTTSSGSLSWTTTEQDLALVHYLANGTRDLSFGTNGIAITPITPTGVTTSNATGSSVLVQPNGAIVELGTAAGANGHSDFVVARYNANGTLDTSFGSGVGYTLVDLGATAQGDSVVLQPNGQMVAAGLVVTGRDPHGLATWGFATVRLNADGSLDSTFGAGGAVVTQVPYEVVQYTVATGIETINNQAMIVDAGTADVAFNTGTQDFALVRYNPTSLDTTTTVASASPNPVNYGQTVTLTATVTAGAQGAPTPTGSVDFFDTTTGKDLGSTTLSGGSAALSIKPTLPIGTQTITVTYGGDGNSLRSTTSLTITVAQIASSVVLSASPNPSTSGQAVTFTATVSASSRPATPTGSVDFFDTTTNTDLGSVTLSASSATLTTSALPVGTQTITASYSGDGNYLPSTTSLGITVNSGSASSAVSTAAPATAAGPVEIIPLSPVVDPLTSSLSIDPTESAPTTASMIPSPGLILQALESPDFLDTLLPVRRR